MVTASLILICVLLALVAGGAVGALVTLALVQYDSNRR
jgi:hypothetical protein